MCQPEWEGVWGRVDACVCMAEFLCCSPEMTTTFLISYNPIQIKIKKRILEWVAISVSRGSSWTRVWTCISCTGRQKLYLLSYCWRAYFLIVSFWLCININLFDEYMTCGSSKAKRDRKFIHSFSWYWTPRLAGFGSSTAGRAGTKQSICSVELA